MSNLDHLVVGVDSSATSEIALRWAAAQAPRRLTLVHAFSPGLALLAASVQINLDSVRAQHERLLSTTWAEPARKAMVDLETILVDDNPANALTQVARTQAASAIVIGHQGHSRWSPSHVGETAGRLLHHCDVPLILTTDTTEPKPASGTIVVGLSLPAEAESPELRWALRFAEHEHARLHLVALVEPFAYVAAIYSLNLTRLHDKMRSQIDALISTLKPRHPTIEFSTEVRDGQVVQELAAIADETNASMVVVGSHHPGPITGFVVGSVARLLPPLLGCPMAAIPKT